jgi:hypothetical protein
LIPVMTMPFTEPRLDRLLGLDRLGVGMGSESEERGATHCRIVAEALVRSGCRPMMKGVASRGGTRLANTPEAAA